MKRNILIIGCLLPLVFSLLLSCQYDSDFGPAPYGPPPVVKTDSTAIRKQQRDIAMKQYLDSLIGTKSAADSLAKANEILPTAQQAYVDMKFGMFIHFNMSTFDRCCCEACRSVSGEWGYPASASVYPDMFHPSKLDIGQWVRAAKSAGMKYMVLTTKHHDGFCIWPSRWNDHNVNNSSWGGGKRDVLREYVDTLRNYVIKVGFYYSIWDKTQGSSIAFIKAQLSELLTNYGPITELYFDGWKWMIGYQRVPYDSIRNLIKTLQPNCLIMENNHYYNMTNTDVVTYEMPVDGPPKEGNTLPSEAGQTIRTDKCWFWHPDQECNVMTAQAIVDDIRMSNSRHASYLLDLTPDTLGLMPQCVVDRLAEVGTLRGVAAQ
jgi:alpha-L-fucosidase